jgi:hypothetical protein
LGSGQASFWLPRVLSSKLPRGQAAMKSEKRRTLARRVGDSFAAHIRSCDHFYFRYAL